jgi:Fe-S cluster assembly iron-binding protein IscA
LLKNESDYSYLRFSYKDGCCKNPKVEITLDNKNSKDIIDNIENLPIVYDMDVLEKVSEITLVYRKNSFMLKTILKNMNKKNCENCNRSCNNNSCNAI